MTLTPPAGDYIVTFSSSANNQSNNQVVTYGIYVGGVLVADSLRNLVRNGGIGTSLVDTAVHSQALVNVDGATAITAQGTSVGNNVSFYQRSLIAIECTF